MKSNDFLTESINDKGLMKAVFISGLPGAGKSTILSKIQDGSIPTRIVNTDKSFEFLAKKKNVEAGPIAWDLLGKASKTINKEMLFNYINGMLPLAIDGTSANVSSLIRRNGLLESIGYDTMMIWVNTNLDAAIDRASKRDRKVEPEFIENVYKDLVRNKHFYENKFGSNFIEVDNNGDKFNDIVASKIYNTVNRFTTSPIANPIGNTLISKMKDDGTKYLIPESYSQEHIDRIISVWYS